MDALKYLGKIVVYVSVICITAFIVFGCRVAVWMLVGATVIVENLSLYISTIREHKLDFMWIALGGIALGFTAAMFFNALHIIFQFITA